MLPRTGFGYEINDMKYYDDACVIIFLNQAFTLDITTITRRYEVRERAHYVQAGSWYPVRTYGGLNSSREADQIQLKRTGITRHKSSIN